MRHLGYGLVLLCVLAPGFAQAQQSVMTLRETLARAQAALAAGDYAQAHATFEALETNFAREPEVQKPSFRLVVLPLHGYTGLLAGEPQTAIQRFNTFLDEFPDDHSRKPFVLFNLARAYQKVGELNPAIEAYRRFVALDPNSSEAALATLSAAELMFQADLPDKGFETLDGLIGRQADGVIRNKARLTALQQAIRLDRTETARGYLLDETWSVTAMPELAVLTYSALKMGHELLAESRYDEAITCFRLVPPYPILIQAQRERLQETRAQFEARVEMVGLYQGGQFWTRFYRNLIARLEQQLEALENAQDYSPSLYLAYGQAYLLADRAHEAWILFETLTRDERLPRELQAEAHYRWILSAIKLGVWEDAFRIAEGFGERFPSSPLVPDALHLLATAHQEAGQYRDAIAVLDRFLLRHDGHRLAPRVLFVRGYNYNLLNDPARARGDFSRFIERYPNHHLHLDARFWRALSYASENNYTAALDALHRVQADAKDHRLEPELAYRIATTLYAMQDFEAALEQINRYLESYPRHSRHEEGRVLLGDIEMGRGNLVRARSIFASIQPSAGHLFDYAVFQTGKILRAVAGAEDRRESREGLLQSHLEHFSDYIRRDDIPLAQKGRISEALYWIGWTHTEQDRPELARSVFHDALARYGNDLKAEQVPDIIDALARTERRLRNVTRSEHNAKLREWIDQQKDAALKADRLTYFSRLNFYLQSLRTSEQRENLIFENVEKVPLDQLDAQGLGQLAAALAENYPRMAEDYLRRLEDEYPNSRHRIYGYYARAVRLTDEARYAAARNQLARFRAEAPLHPLSQEVALRYAATLTQLTEYEKSREVLEDLLRNRGAKGRPHAKALLALSRNAEAAGKLERAIPYAQRVYNVYRAYPELAAEAYWMSARLFERIDDPVAAYRTLEEMLSDVRLQSLPLADQAYAKKEALLEALPESALREPETQAESTQGEKAQTEVIP